MAKTSYFDERNKNTLDTLKALLKELPKFCVEFFIGIEQRTMPLTRLNYARDFRIFFAFLRVECSDFNNKEIRDFSITDLEKISSSDIEMFISYLSNFTYDGIVYTNSASAKARKLSAIRSMFKYFYNKNYLEKDVAAKVALPKIHNKPIIRLEGDEVYDMLDVADSANGLSARQQAYHKKTKLRDVAIVTLFLGTGIRISELVGLDVGDIDFANNAFKVTRKGGDQEILYFNDDVLLALLEYVEQERDYYCNENSPTNALFLSLQKRRITVRAIEFLIKKYAQEITPLKKITPHKLRSTFGTNLYRETNDIYVVAEMLGHKDINVTKKHYADTSSDIKREASKKVKLRRDNSNDDNNQ